MLAVTHDGQSRPGIASVFNSAILCCAELREQSQIARSHKMEPQEKLRNLPNHGHLQDVPSQ